MVKFRKIDRVYGVLENGDSVNMGGGEIVCFLDGKPVNTAQIGFASVPVIKKRERGSRANTSNGPQPAQDSAVKPAKTKY